MNKQITTKEGKIKFKKELGSNRNKATNYSSQLFEKEMKAGAKLDIYEGLCILYWQHEDSTHQHIITQGQSFLHVLYYLAKKHQMPIPVTKPTPAPKQEQKQASTVINERLQIKMQEESTFKKATLKENPDTSHHKIQLELDDDVAYISKKSGWVLSQF